MILFLLACSTSTTPEVPAPAPPSAHTEPAPAQAKKSAPDVLKGLSQRQICEDDALLLTKYPYEKVQAGFHDLCCGGDKLPDDHMLCSLDWPSSDVPSCKMYDVMRNAIFARHGYVFSNPEYKKMFEGEPWYTPVPDLDPSTLPPIALDNIKSLKKFKAEKRGCMD